MIIDCHTHKLAPCPEAVVSATLGETLLPGRIYSLGIHPWHIPADPSAMIRELEEQASSPAVVAIGEAGLDTLCKTPMWLQIKIFEKQIIISELIGKPLMVHCVRTASEIAQMRRSLRATRPWIIHGFRGKPTVLKILLEAGCYISYGEKYNPESLTLTPLDRLLAETDESPLPIADIIASLSATRGQDLTPIIANNTRKLFNHDDI